LHPKRYRESLHKRLHQMRILQVGFGTVGQSLAELLLSRREELVARLGINPKVVGIVDSRGGAFDPKGLDLAAVLKTKRNGGTVAAMKGRGKPGLQAFKAIQETEAEVLVETTPTNVKSGEPGMTNIEAAFKKGLHVVTTNKGPLALALPALMELAGHNNVHFLFSGTVGGGTPVLDFGKRCLSTDRILAIRGIVNGTSNFILDRMESTGCAYAAALKEAQRLGYSEEDPSLDVDGWDTASKMVIMANWLMGKEVTLADFDVKGIRGVTPAAVRRAASKGKSMKLVGFVGESMSVKPTEVDRTDPMCVRGVMNAVKFTSEFAGDEIVAGRGAGGMETASAVLRDLLEVRERLARER
jgi:homoserine dehydrogenase